MPDLSGLIWNVRFFVAAYTALNVLLLLQVGVVVAVGYIVGRRRGAWIGLLVGAVSTALTVAAFVSTVLGPFTWPMWIHYALVTIASIAMTVVARPKSS